MKRRRLKMINDSKEDIRMCLKCDMPRCVNCVELPDKMVDWYGEQVNMRELGRRLNVMPLRVKQLVKACERAEARKVN